MADGLTLIVQLGDVDQDLEDLELSTDRLRGELVDSGLGRVELLREQLPVPDGARPVDPVTIGALVIGVERSLKALSSLSSLLERWVEARASRSIRIKTASGTIDLKNASRSDQRRLVDDWIGKNLAAPPSHDG